jgi:glycosyltransferase involved in cell wall biosynthesis
VRQAGVRPIYFVHDLIPLTHPQFCRAGEAERHARRMRTVLSTGAGVIGNSQATLDDLARFAADERLPRPPAVPAWLGTTPIRHAAVAGPDRPTFVALGTIEARKNHLLLLEIWSRLAARLGAKAPRLLVIGQRGWEADEVFRILDGEEGLRGHVVELNHCSDEELARHLASARALLFPSKAEGYGLPLVEAMSLGVPVIASDLPVFREIGQGIPLLLNPDDDAAWEAAILDFAQPKSAARDEQLQQLESFRAPTWGDHFRAVEEWLARIG